MNDPRLAAAVASIANRLKVHDSLLQQMSQLMKASADSPKWIEDIPGKRSPYFGLVNLSIAADSTSKVEGTLSVNEDGPFVITAVGLFFQKTSGAYQGIWGFASAADARIAQTGQQHGYAYLYDQPHIISGDLDIIDRGSDRNWQSRSISSALFSPQAGGVYALPIHALFDRNSVVEVAFTPGVSIPYTGTVQVALLGYKIVQGASYQP